MSLALGKTEKVKMEDIQSCRGRCEYNTNIPRLYIAGIKTTSNTKSVENELMNT